ncbi:acyl-CoA dehydrogenase family protein, partial [Nocardia farcinica]
MSVWDTPERQELRSTVRRFVEREILPDLDAWERAGELPRELHKKAGELGLLGIDVPESVGGSGGNAIDAVILGEEFHQAGASGGAWASLMTCGIALPHIIASGNAEQIDRWVRPTLTGDL